MLHIVVAMQAMFMDATDAVSRRMRREDGATAVEWVLIATVIALGIAAALGLLATRMNTRLNSILP